jgi:hypothetical protein
VDLVRQTKALGRLPVVNFAAGGVATPADAALMMQLGMDGVFVGSGIFKSGDPAKRARAIVQVGRGLRAAGRPAGWLGQARGVLCGRQREALHPPSPQPLLPPEASPCFLLPGRHKTSPPQTHTHTHYPHPPTRRLSPTTTTPPSWRRSAATWVSPWWASTCGRRGSSRTRSARSWGAGLWGYLGSPPRGVWPPPPPPRLESPHPVRAALPKAPAWSRQQERAPSEVIIACCGHTSAGDTTSARGRPMFSMRVPPPPSFICPSL